QEPVAGSQKPEQLIIISDNDAAARCTFKPQPQQQAKRQQRRWPKKPANATKLAKQKKTKKQLK
ncbi:unnamed protein product, partial [Ceratitis capitata]